MINGNAIKPAICCLGYNRPDSLKRLLESIGIAVYPCEDITLIISIDECNESGNVEEVAQKFDWLHGKKIIKRYKKRLGVRKHTLMVGDYSYQYGAVIYLEDDIVVSPGFYVYVYEALKKYRCQKNIFGVALYNQKWIGSAQTEFVPSYCGSDVYLFGGDVSWGQCWIDEQWRDFHEWYDAHINTLPEYNPFVPKSVYTWNTKTSWSKFISFYMAEKHQYYVVPYVSYSTCFSDRGEHTVFNSDQCQVPLSQNIVPEFRFNSIDKCVKYDAFFEREDSFVESIAGISFEDICVDFNGEKYDFSSYKAVLTTKKLDYECLCSFGINMEPIELNVIYKVAGNAIHLYKLSRNGSKENLFDKIQLPTTCEERLYHQLGKYRTKNYLILFTEKIKQIIKK